MSKPPCVTHRWKRVGPFVVPLGESERYGTSETYNAECQRCGRREWLHWPEPVYPKLRWRS